MKFSTSDREHYLSSGFLQVSGLIRRDIVDRAHACVLRISENATPGPHHVFVRDEAVISCFTKELCSVARQLAGSRDTFGAPSVAYAIAVIGTSGVWERPVPHIDHAHETDRHKTFPPPFCIGC